MKLKLVDWATIGFEEVFYPNKLNPKRKHCFLRIVAKVELIDEPINDPDNKSVAREIVKIEQAARKLNWGKKGKRGEKLIELAKEKYFQAWGENI